MQAKKADRKLADSHQETLLEHLSERFARFRRNHPRGSHIPESLQIEVAQAVSEGVSPTVVCRACGVSWVQVHRWQERHEPRGRGNLGPVAAPRVLSVVPSDRPGTGEAELEFSLTVGAWQMRIRLTPSDA